MVRAETCSEVEGSNSITLPCELPVVVAISLKDLSRIWHSNSDVFFVLISPSVYWIKMSKDLPNATFPFFIHAATLIGSYETNLDTSSPVNRSHTRAVCPVS